MSLDLQAQLLIAFGFLFILAESLVPAFGLLAIVGAIAFVWGGLLVHHNPEIHTVFLNPASVWAIGILAILLMLAIGYMVKRAYSKPTTTGQESLIGETAKVISWSKDQGQIQVHGEIWLARSSSPLKLHKGDSVEITETEDLILTIKEGN